MGNNHEVRRIPNRLLVYIVKVGDIAIVAMDFLLKNRSTLSSDLRTMISSRREYCHRTRSLKRSNGAIGAAFWLYRMIADQAQGRTRGFDIFEKGKNPGGTTRHNESAYSALNGTRYNGRNPIKGCV